MTRSMISSVVSRTMYFCPEVSVITVSGVTSMCSIRSEFTISGVWFSLVILIMELPTFPMTYSAQLHIEETAGLYTLK